MIEIKRMHTCSFQTALDVWNKGFQGYFVDMTISLDVFMKRLSSEGISLEHSLIAFHEGAPVGFLLNGFRTVGDKKIAWNGGTGVVPNMRGKGVGRVLVGAALELYQAESVNVATLEAICGNKSAIALYTNNGYQVIDELTNLTGADSPPVFMKSQSAYNVQRVHPSVVSTLSFYYERAAWQTQWQSLVSTCGEAIVVYLADGSTVAYALFKKNFDALGKVRAVALCQCEVDPKHHDREAIIDRALDHVFPASDTYQRSTYNFRKSNDLVIQKLLNAGFTTFIDQVQMIKTISES